MNLSTLLWVGIVLLGSFARLAPHPWNFTPLVALGLFAGWRARSAALGAVATIGSLVLSDAVLGFYRGFWYVYAAMLIPVLLGRLLRDRPGLARTAGAALFASVSFFLITNGMVWATGAMYPHTGAGLAACYVAGIPFYRNQLAGDAFYTAVLFGGYAALSRLVLPVRQAA